MKNAILLIVIFSLSVLNAQVKKNTTDNLLNSEMLNIISVTIGGEFLIKGTFPASRTERVDQFITRVFNEAKQAALQAAKDDNSLQQVKSKLESFATRGIILKSRNGSEQNIDLEKFRLTADFNLNPYLNDGDVIIFPVKDIKKYFVGITGAVRKPGAYHFVEGDKLSDILILARGIDSRYKNVKKAEISRLSFDGNTEEVFSVELNSDFELKNGDRIRVLADKLSQKDFKVLVLGEVNNPGYIYVTKNSTKLDKVLKQASVKESASLRRSELIRNNSSMDLLRKESIEKQWGDKTGISFVNNYYKQLELMLSSRMANITHEDTSFFRVDNQLRLLQARHNIDFENLTEDKNNVIVKDGDVILIPEKTDLVYIYGQVGASGYYKFDNRKSVLEYVEMAGGLGEDAQGEDDIVVIKSKTYHWQTLDENENIKIEPGDHIWVPKSPPRTIGYYVKNLGTVISALGTLALIAIQIWIK